VPSFQNALVGQEIVLLRLKVLEPADWDSGTDNLPFETLFADFEHVIHVVQVLDARSKVLVILELDAAETRTIRKQAKSDLLFASVLGTPIGDKTILVKVFPHRERARRQSRVSRVARQSRGQTRTVARHSDILTGK
jgi:hypothetical protein